MVELRGQAPARREACRLGASPLLPAPRPKKNCKKSLSVTHLPTLLVRCVIVTGSGIESRKGDAGLAAKGPPVTDSRFQSDRIEHFSREEPGWLHTQPTSSRSRITGPPSSPLFIIEDPRENFSPPRQKTAHEHTHVGCTPIVLTESRPSLGPSKMGGVFPPITQWPLF